MKLKYCVLPAALIATTLIANHAQSADSASTEIQMTGYAQPVCKLPGGQQTSASNATYNNGVLTISNLLDPGTATVKAASVKITFPDVMCNYKATISIASMNGGLKTDGTTPNLTGDFLETVPYKIEGTWGGLALPILDTATAGTTPVSKDAGGANRGVLELTVSTVDGNTPVVEGQMSDRIVLKVGSVL
jgi:hypothetical protein